MSRDRRTWVTGAVAVAALVALSACRPRPSAPPAPDPVPEASGAVVAGAAETSGLVGPGMGDLEVIEVEDVGPPAPVVVITASLKGYTEPCGCTLDLVLGGIDRATGFARAAAALGTASIALDAGNTLFEYAEIEEISRPQEVRKAAVIATALREIGTLATVPGPTDLANGLDFYLETMGSAGVTVLAANLRRPDDAPIGPAHLVRPLGDESLGVIGASDPALFADRADLASIDARPAIDGALAAARAEGATITIALWHGDLASARSTFADIEGLDFIVVGHAPRKTDEVERIGSAWTLEVYDQGRHVGRLKLARGEAAPDGAAWQSARAGSAAEAERLTQLIADLEERLAALPPTPAGEPEPPIVAAQRARIERYRAELAEMEAGAVEFASDARTFLWNSEPMRPGYRTWEPITEAMIAYNADLASIAAQTVEEVPPVAEGEPSYVGGARCATCHVQEHAFWQTTQHAHAIDTLIERNKQFDRNCIGCHVTGYRQPGGSVLGHTEGLENVQCEQCHGPGSLHVANPTLRNVPGGVWTEVPESQCATCHVPEHSPRFVYETYLGRVVGPGHGMP